MLGNVAHTYWLTVDFIGGLLAGQLAHRSGAPPLLGAIVAGLLLAWGEGISPDVMDQADTLRNGFNVLWIVAETVLFVLLGATVDVGVLNDRLLPGLLLLALG